MVPATVPTRVHTRVPFRVLFTGTVRLAIKV